MKAAGVSRMKQRATFALATVLVQVAKAVVWVFCTVSPAFQRKPASKEPPEGDGDV